MERGGGWGAGARLRRGGGGLGCGGPGSGTCQRVYALTVFLGLLHVSAAEWNATSGVS